MKASPSFICADPVLSTEHWSTCSPSSCTSHWPSSSLSGTVSVFTPLSNTYPLTRYFSIKLASDSASQGSGYRSTHHVCMMCIYAPSSFVVLVTRASLLLIGQRSIVRLDVYARAVVVTSHDVLKCYLSDTGRRRHVIKEDCV